jgi:SNF2 family DNA or RNA helicase
MLAIGAAKAEHGLCKQIPGCNWNKRDDIWRAPLSWASYVAFKTVWARQPVTESPSLLDWAASRWQDVLIAYGLRSRLDATGQILAELEEIEYNHDPPHLFPYQRGDVQWLVTQKRCMLTHPRGNGKSPPLIRGIQVLKRRGTGTPALIICPGPAILAWRDKLARWAPELSVRVVAGTALRRREALDGELADVYVIGWATVRLHTRLAAYPSQAALRCPEHKGVDDRITVGRCEVHEKELNFIPFSLVVADESHRMKDARSKQTRAAQYLAWQAEYFWPATGTPAADNIGDFWPQGRAVSPLDFPAKSRYLDLFAVKNLNFHGGTEILGIRPENEDAYHAIVQPMMRRVPREIARQYQPPLLPPEFRYPEMSPAQSRAYKQMAKELLADFEGYGQVVPANSLVRFGRLCQLATAMVEPEDGEDGDGFTAQRVRLCLPSSKADDLLDFLEDNPGPLVVAANSPQVVELARGKLHAAKIPSVAIIGGMSHDQQYQAQQHFQEGKVRVCFITSAGAEAIDLFAASAIYFIQPDPSFLSRDQKIGRVDRIGQQFPVRQVYAISPGTLDRRLYQLGCDKEERAAQLTRDPDLLRWLIKGDDNDSPAGRTAKPAAIL